MFAVKTLILSKFFGVDDVGNNNFENSFSKRKEVELFDFLAFCLLSWTSWYLFCLLLEAVLLADIFVRKGCLN